MVILPATSADADEISTLVNTAYRGSGGAPGWTHESTFLTGLRTTPAVVREVIAAGRRTILLMRNPESGKLAGCVTVEPMDDALVWHLSMLAVDPQQQMRGLGRTLMTGAESYLRSRGASSAHITVIQIRESLIAWYERRGYQRTGETEAFPYGDHSVGLPLREDLHFVVLQKRL